MLQQLAMGTLLIAMSVALQAIFVILAARVLSRFGDVLLHPPNFAKSVLALVLVVLWLILGVTLSVWLWAAVLLWFGALSSLPEALYFVVVSFTTLGYGDIVLAEPWRLLASMCAVNGLMVFGLNTAFTFEFFVRLGRAQERSVVAQNKR